MKPRSQSEWREDLQRMLTKAASSVDDFVDIRWRYMKKRFGWDGVPKIQPYIGYASHDTVWMHGRVLTNPPADLPAEQDSWWENLADTYQRYASDEVPGCEIELRFGAETFHATTDAEGYFHCKGPIARSDSPPNLWSNASMQILRHPRVNSEDSIVRGRVLSVHPQSAFGVISDVDDTVLHTGVTRLLTMAKLTFLGNARTRLPLPGAAALYQALQAFGPAANPIFYVSSSPWNLFDLLEDFLELNTIPAGPLLLRDLGFDDNKLLKEGHKHKLEKARRIMNAFPELPFVLIGDSGQEDASLYAAAAEEFGDRVRAIFIRDVDPAQESDRDAQVRKAVLRADAAGVPMFLAKDSIQMSQGAAKLGLIDPALLDQIRDATVVDGRRAT